MTNEDYKLISGLKGIAIKRFKIVEDVEDIMQDVFLRILLRKDFESMSVNEKERFAVCLIKNRCTDFYRIKKHWGIKVDPDEIKLKVKPEAYSKIELKEVLNRASNYQLCETLLLTAAGYKNIEVAAMTGQKLNTVLGRCRYARKYLRA